MKQFTCIVFELQNRVGLAAFALCTVLLAACTSSGSEPEVTPDGGAPVPAEAGSGDRDDALADTRWRLTEIQSMDDAVGTARPENPGRYLMHLHSDGTATLTLDCNRATGRWVAEPSADPSNGRFRFEGLAMTTAACPEPTLANRLAADLGYVRGFLLRDGRLYLSLYADGGIVAWEPVEGVPFESTPDHEIEAAVLRTHPEYEQETIEALGQARYVYSRVDLDDDGSEEVFVFLLGPYFCGTGGCTLLLFDEAPDGLALVDDFPISRAPVFVSEMRTRGWRDLIRRESGGGAPTSYVRHRFDGDQYIEVGRTPEPPEPDALTVLTGDLQYESAVPLEPAIGLDR